MSLRDFLPSFILKYLDKESENSTDAVGGIAEKQVEKPKRAKGAVTTRLKESGEGYFRNITAGGDSARITISFIDTTRAISAFVKREALISIALTKYLNLVTKKGFVLSGENNEALTYIRERLLSLNMRSNETLNEIIRKVVIDLFLYGNAFIAINRDKKSLLGKQYTLLGTKFDPIDSIMSISPRHMNATMDTKGKIVSYQQVIDDGKVSKTFVFKAHDVIHFTTEHHSGEIAGSSQLNPVIDDIKSLRKAEEMLLKQAHAFSDPLKHATIGTDEMPVSDDPDEINMLSGLLQTADSSSTVVTDHRVKLSYVTPSNTYDLEKVVNYFLKRTMFGLGLTEMDLGSGNSANRNTAERLEGLSIEKAKLLQIIISEKLNEKLIIPLLYEWPQEKVNIVKSTITLGFPEIDETEQRIKETHYLNIFNNNGITHGELREKLHMNVIDKYKDELLAETGLTRKDDASASTTKSTATPANQYGEKPKPKSPKDLAKVRQFLDEIERNIDIIEKDSKVFTERLKNHIVGLIEEKFFKEIELLSNDNEDIRTTIKEIISSDFDSINEEIEQKFNKIIEISDKTKKKINLSILNDIIIMRCSFILETIDNLIYWKFFLRDNKDSEATKVLNGLSDLMLSRIDPKDDKWKK